MESATQQGLERAKAVVVGGEEGSLLGSHQVGNKSTLVSPAAGDAYKMHVAWMEQTVTQWVPSQPFCRWPWGDSGALYIFPGTLHSLPSSH